MLTNGRAFLLRAPWAIVFPGVAILLTTLAFNLIVRLLTAAVAPFAGFAVPRAYGQA